MPVNMKLYPRDWPDIRRRILERAENRCELCGALNYQPHPITGSKVVLTIAHMENPDPMDCRDSNLKALCQKCHNQLDAPMRAKNAAKTRAAKKAKAAEEAGQGVLL